MPKSDSLVIIPTYNEKENIENIIRAIFKLEHIFHILIIEDNSPDGTANIVKTLQDEFPGRLFMIERNGKLGLGTAYITGFKWGLSQGYDYLFEMDADFSHKPEDLPRLYKACHSDGYDVAIGSRYISGVNVVNWPIGRVLMSYFASKYVRTFLSTIQSRPYLVLDQFVSDGNPDIDYHTKYCGPFKQLCVFRDPRDVFVTGVIKNEYWIPKNPEDFIIWYRANVSDYLTYSHPNLLILRFEDFVLDYDNVSEKIMNFVGINKSHHIHPKEWFDPSISCKNIGLWKYFEDQQAIRSIEHELGEYCYHST